MLGKMVFDGIVCSPACKALAYYSTMAECLLRVAAVARQVASLNARLAPHFLRSRLQVTFAQRRYRLVFAS